MGLTMQLLFVCFAVLASVLPWGVNAMDDVKLKFCKERWYNPSLVEHDDQFISAAKLTNFKRMKKKTWWINTLALCEGNKDSIHDLHCKAFDPFGGSYQECELDNRVRGGKLDTSGLGDVKMWSWPGKGVYAIFGRKPERNSTQGLCTDLIVYHQWLVQVKNTARAGDPWNLKEPLALLPSRQHQYPPEQKYVMEKNWMPFVHKDAWGEDHLYVTYMVQPHIVFQLYPNGTALHRWTTHNRQLFDKFAEHDVHGGPPVVFVPPSLTKGDGGLGYYLGIMHHIEKFDNGRVRLYRHFAFKVEPQPPFAITAISDELPLVYNQTYKSRTAWVAFVSGLYVNEEGTIFITYGAADIECRALTMTVEEMEGLFTGNMEFREAHVPYDKYETETQINKRMRTRRVRALQAAYSSEEQQADAAGGAAGHQQQGVASVVSRGKRVWKRFAAWAARPRKGSAGAR